MLSEEQIRARVHDELEFDRRWERITIPALAVAVLGLVALLILVILSC